MEFIDLRNVKIFALIGLLVNFLGSILIAFSVIKNPNGSHQMINGRKVYLASIDLFKFRWGITLLIVGFLIQMLDNLK